MTPTEQTLRAVEAWLVRWPADQGAPFPYVAVARVIAACGTGGLPVSLREALVEAWRRTRDHDDPAGIDPQWMVAAWLDCVTSQARDAATYDTYTMSALFMTWCRLGDIGSRSERLITALTAHLVRHELARATRTTDPSARRSRIAAALHVGRSLGSPHDGSSRSRSFQDRPVGDDDRVTRRSAETHTAAGPRDMSDPAVVLVHASVPIVTTQPDEPLFLRVVQIMELLIFRAAACTDAATLHAACFPASDQAPALATVLRRITGILGEATRLFRLVATIDSDQFAIIRDATAGTGALQSVSFARFERRCRGAAGLRAETDGAVTRAAAPVPRSGLSRTLHGVLATLERTDPETAKVLRRTMDEINTAWRRWKRTHHGIAHRIIGRVSGTGGTDGVRYLARHREEELL